MECNRTFLGEIVIINKVLLLNCCCLQCNVVEVLEAPYNLLSKVSSGIPPVFCLTFQRLLRYSSSLAYLSWHCSSVSASFEFDN